VRSRCGGLLGEGSTCLITGAASALQNDNVAVAAAVKARNPRLPTCIAAFGLLNSIIEITSKELKARKSFGLTGCGCVGAPDQQG
jgi:hypothetical protein